MSDVTLVVADFRTDYPAYSNVTTYPDDLIERKFDLATCFISKEDYGYLNGECRVQAIYMMTAHLLWFADQIILNPKGATGLITAATVDKVQVTRASPPFVDAWQYWLIQSPYGQELMALLEAFAAGGLYIGGLPERTAFRKVGGTFATSYPGSGSSWS